MKFIFVGNPGTGKSTFLNGVFGGKYTFESGVSVGQGKTTRLQWKTHSNGDEFADTPGLADVKLREDAAKAITDALKKGKDQYKIIFFLTSDGGRVRPEDVKTIQTILSAVKEVQEYVPYGVVVNKLSKKLKKKFDSQFETLRVEVTPDIDEKPYPPDKIFLALRNEDLEDEENCSWEVDAEFKKFLYKDVRPIWLKPEQVSDVSVKDYDKDVEKYERALRKLREDNEKMMERVEAVNKMHERQQMTFGSLIGKGIDLFGEAAVGTMLGGPALGSISALGKLK